MKINEHKLIQDLLPSYIDGLTSEETNNYIEEHISSCKECDKILNEMKSKLQEENHTNLNDSKINYAKKVKRKLNFLGLLIWIFLILIIIIVLDFDRKAIILRNLQSKRK